MKILMLTSRMDIGGAESHIYTLCTELTRLGHKVFCASSGGRTAELLSESGVMHISLPLDKKDPVSVVRSLCGIRRIIREHSIDTVHSHSRIPSVLAGWLRKHMKTARFGFVSTAHMPFHSSALLRRLSDWGERTVAVSEDIKDYLTGEYGVSKENISVILNGIDTDSFTPSDSEKRAAAKKALGISPDALVLCCAARSSQSRAAMLLYLSENAPSVLREGEVLLLLLSGAVGFERDMTERIREAASRANCLLSREAVIIIEGKADICPYLCASDIFIGASRAAAEAMSAGVCVILAGNEGYGGIINGQNAREHIRTNLTCRDSRIDFSAVLSDIERLRDADERSRLSEFCRGFALSHFSSVQMAKETEQVYLSLVPREAKGEILLVGHYGADNVGDDAALVRIADALGCDYRLHIVCKSKKKLGRICPHRGICRTDVLSIVRTAKKARAVIFGGGNLMQDITSRRSLFYYAALARVCRRYCGKLAVFSNGIGPLLHRRSEKYAEMLLAAANYISMRESDSARYARSLTAREDIRLGADIALIGRSNGEGAQRLIEKYGLTEGGYFVVCPRVGQHRRDTEALVGFISEKKREKLTALVIPMQRDADARVCKSIVDRADGAVLARERLDADDIAELLSHARFALGARLHMSILALRTDTAFVGYDTDGRIGSFVSYAGCGGCLRSGSFGSQQLLSAVDAEVTAHSRRPYAHCAKKLLERAHEDIVSLCGFVGEQGE